MKSRMTRCGCLLTLFAAAILTPSVQAQSNPPCAARSGTAFVNWPQLHGDPCHTGYNPNEFLLSTGTVANLTVAWAYATLSDSSPAVLNGVAYVGSYDHNVYALDTATGAPRWKYTTGGVVTSSPAVLNGVVYVGSYDHNLYALDAATGAPLWNYTTGAEIGSSPAVANGVVYIPSGVGYLYALDAGTGALIWENHQGDATPTVADGMVYVSSGSSGLNALDAGTGTLLWTYTTEANVIGAAAVANGVVYFGSYDGNLYAVTAATGTLLWQYATGTAGTSSPAVANGVVYFDSENLCCQSKHSQAQTGVYALDAVTGALLWQYATSDWFFSSPVVANGVVYAASTSSNSNFYAIDAATGAVLWTHSTGGDLSSSPAVVNGMVLVAGGDGQVWAFHLPGH